MEISVIIPLYNKAPYIQRAIDSIMNQTYVVSEIIVIDDGSSDNGYKLVASLAYQNPNIKLFKQENHGVSFTRNKGVQLAESDFVAFLDADDEWKPDYLSHIQRLYNNFPDCGAYATSFEVIGDQGQKTNSLVTGVPPAPWIGIIPNLFEMMQNTYPFYTSSIVIKKSVFQELGGFPLNVNRGEDLILWIRLAVRHPIAYSPSFQVIYHTEAENRACTIFSSDDQAAHCTLIEQMFANKEVPSAIQKDLRDYYASQQISKARDLMKAGYSKKSRDLLKKINKNKKYSRKRILLHLMSFIPHNWLRYLINFHSINN